MRQFLFPCLLAAAAAALLCAPAAAPAGEGYVERGGFYWLGEVPYTREKVYDPVSYTYSCGYYYPAAQTYHWSYTRAAVYTPPAPTPPAVPAYAPDWKVQVLKYAASRDDQEAYLQALQALGIQGQTYPFQGAGYSKSLSLGSYGAQGNTVYGYSFQSLREAYGDTNLNALYQQQGRLTQGAQSLAAQAHSEHTDLVGRAGDNAARVAEILAKARAAEIALNAANPQPVTREVITGQGGGQGTANKVMPPAPPDGGEADPAALTRTKEFLQRVAVPRCGSCHTGANAKGKFDVLTYPRLAAEQKAAVWERLLSRDKDKVMPRDGPPLTPAELKAFLAN